MTYLKSVFDQTICFKKPFEKLNLTWNILKCRFVSGDFIVFKETYGWSVCFRAAVHNVDLVTKQINKNVDKVVFVFGKLSGISKIHMFA